MSADNAKAIRTDVEARGSGVSLVAGLATLAAILIGFAVMSFVAANWQAMSKLARLIVILLSLWSLLGFGGWFAQRGATRFADGALLAGSAVYGAGIMLIAQMYHMDGHPPDAVWLWAIGTVALGLMTRSNSVLAAALVLFVVWSFMEMTSGFALMSGAGIAPHRVHWGFLPAWASVAVGVAMIRWRAGLHLLAAALAWWLVCSGYMIGNGTTLRGHLPVLLAGLALMGASIAFGPAIDRWRQVSGAMLTYGMVVTFAAAIALQFFVDDKARYLLVTGALSLLAIAGLVAWGWKTANRPAMWLAYCAFTIEVFAIYLRKVGTLLGTSGFFLATGLLLGVLAWIAWRLSESNSQQVAS